MKVIILGAGVVGISAAYLLGSRGHQVEVVERRTESAAETSFANGGQLSFCHAEPWANPSVLPKIARWLFKEDAPLIFRPRADLDMIAWGLRFLANCTESRARNNSVSILRLGLYSKKKLEQIRVFSGVKFDNRREGILHVFTDKTDFEHTKRQARYQERLGCPVEVATRARCADLEPALAHAGKPICGGIFLPLDESGDAWQFTQQLATLCASEHKTLFRYGTEVKKIQTRAGKVTSVLTDKGEVTADAYVVALGSYSPLHLRPLGIRVPIYPMKGYSVTFPVTHYTPQMSLTDAGSKIVYSRLGDRLRVAGTAEFAGYDTSLRPKRVDPILRAVRALFPKCEYAEPLSQWACLRPSTPDGPPILGKTKIANLYLNTGHGTLGWTQAAGSAALLADILENRPTEIALDGLTIDRY